MESDTGPRDAARLWSALVDVYQPVLRDVVADLERHAGIDSGTYSALAYLDRAGGRMRLGALHELMRVRYSQPGLSRLVQRMEADRMLTRVVDPDDRRSTIVALTGAGRTRFRHAHVVYKRSLEAHLGSFVEPGAVAAIATALEQLAASRRQALRTR